MHDFRDVLRVLRAGCRSRRAGKVRDSRRRMERHAPTACVPRPPGPSNLYGLISMSVGGVAVVGVFEDDDVFAAGVGTGEAQGEFVGFAAGVDEIADAQGFRQKLREALGITVHVVVEVARVGVEQGDLLLHGANDARMAVADERHVVVNVEIGAAGVVVEELLPTADNFERMLIGDAEIFSEQLAACG